MKPMADNVFLDSNILVYSYSNSEFQKRTIARKIISESNSIISTQVLQELCNIITRKFKFSYEQAQAAIKENCQNNELYVNTESTILRACEMASRYGFSFFDSLIVAAGLESNCTLLYSEDMQDGQIIEERLTIRNPFS